MGITCVTLVVMMIVIILSHINVINVWSMILTILFLKNPPKNANQLVVTNIYGQAQISLKSTSEISISFVGYQIINDTIYPNETKVYCAHEYTLQNALFALSLEPNNEAIKKKIDKIKDLRSKNLPTIPSTLAEEKKVIPFLKCDDKNFLNSIGLNESSSTDNFRVIRQMKDNF